MSECESTDRNRLDSPFPILANVELNIDKILSKDGMLNWPTKLPCYSYAA